MSTRVTQDEVRAVAQASSTADARFAVKAANVVVEEYLVGKGMSEALLTQIELYLSAHFLTLTLEKGPLQMDKMGEAAERYHNIYTAGYGSTRFGQQAMLLDSTGKLAALTSGVIRPGLTALFTTVGSQPPDTPEGQYGLNESY